ncbi:MAG: DedA family protein [Alphaproteobacteria bacterium]
MGVYPTDLAAFLELIRQNGEAVYSFMFAFAASHNLLLTLFAGYAASTGALGLGTLIFVCWLGSFVGDAIRFWIGRRYGASLTARFPRFERMAKIVARLADRHFVWMILFHRYPNGIRSVGAFAYGRSSLPWGKFLVLNAIAAGLWACAVVSAGYAFGQLSEKMLSDASQGVGLVMLALFLGLSWFLSRKLERVAESSAR